MFKYILEQAGDINWMAIFALVTFVSLFLITLFTVFKRSPAYINKMSNLPLDETNPLTQEKNSNEQ